MWWAPRCWSKPQISELQSSEPISWKTTRRDSQTLTHNERRVPFADAAGKWAPRAKRANLVRPLLQTTRRLTAAQTTGIHQSVGVDRNWLAHTGTRVQFHLVWWRLFHSAGILTLQQLNETELGRELFAQLFFWTEIGSIFLQVCNLRQTPGEEPVETTLETRSDYTQRPKWKEWFKPVSHCCYRKINYAKKRKEKVRLGVLW